MMPGQYMDRQLTCADCGTSFTFSSGEQERFAELGFTNEPKRCQPCRAAKRKGSAGGGRGPTPGPRAGGGAPQREFHTTRCAECGKDARVPFKPRGDRPVYCSDCFGNRG